MDYPRQISIREVSPRDGLQAEPVFVPTATKVELIGHLVRAGFPRVNATSFSSPRAIPQLADSEAVSAQLDAWPRDRFDATVPNERGVRRAIDAGFRTITVFVSASDVGSRSNVGTGTAEAMAEAKRSISLALSHDVTVIATISKAFGSPFGDTVTGDSVLRLAHEFVEAGVTRIALGDTSGEADPQQVHDLVTDLVSGLPTIELSMHFHDTRGLALANVLAAMDAGVTHFDSAVGGIGGSPYTRNSAGNLATEDLLYMCHSMNISTGIDLSAVLDAYDLLHKTLGRDLPARLSRLDRADAELAQ